MSAKILFQRDRLTVTDSNLIVGKATIFYPSISALSIYDGRPMLGNAIVGLIGIIPTGFFFLMGARIFGPYFPVKSLLLMLLPFVALVVVGFVYRVKCLFVTVENSQVAVLKAKDVAVLEEARRAIEEGKSAYEKVAH